MQLLQCLDIFVVKLYVVFKGELCMSNTAKLRSPTMPTSIFHLSLFPTFNEDRPALYRFTPHFHLFFAGSFANHRVNGMNGVAIQFFPQRLVNELLTLNQPLALKGIGIHLNGDVTSIGIIIRAGYFYIIGPQRCRALLRANIDDGLALSGLGRHRPGE